MYLEWYLFNSENEFEALRFKLYLRGSLVLIRLQDNEPNNSAIDLRRPISRISCIYLIDSALVLGHSTSVMAGNYHLIIAKTRA